ncbi:hypothetical protein ACA910_012910 [Epithemia clementina (nom. ined.)]
MSGDNDGNNDKVGRTLPHRTLAESAESFDRQDDNKNKNKSNCDDCIAATSPMMKPMDRQPSSPRRRSYRKFPAPSSSNKLRCCSTSSSSWNSSSCCWRVIIAPSPSSRHLMRAVSALGMDDPVFQTTKPEWVGGRTSGGGGGGGAGVVLLPPLGNNTTTPPPPPPPPPLAHSKRLWNDELTGGCGAGIYYGGHEDRSPCDLHSVVSVASDPTADLHTGIDLAVYNACLRDLGHYDGLSTYSRKQLCVSSPQSAASKKRLRRPDHRPLQEPEQQPEQQLLQQQRRAPLHLQEEEITLSFSSDDSLRSPESTTIVSRQEQQQQQQQHRRHHIGLTLDDVLRGASAGRGGGGGGTPGQTKNGPPKRAVRKRSFVQPRRDQAPHLAQRKASLVVEEKEAPPHSLLPQHMAQPRRSFQSLSPTGGVVSTRTVPKTTLDLESSCCSQEEEEADSKERLPPVRVGEQVNGSSLPSNQEPPPSPPPKFDVPPKMAQRIESGIVDNTAIQEEPSLVDPVTLRHGQGGVSLEAHQRGGNSLLEDDDGPKDCSSGNMFAAVAAEHHNKKVEAGCHDGQPPPNQVESLHPLSTTKQSPLDLPFLKTNPSPLHPTLAGMCKSKGVLVSNNEDETVEEDPEEYFELHEDCDEDASSPYTSMEEGFTESLPEIYTDYLDAPADLLLFMTEDPERKEQNRFKPPFLPTRKASATRQCISALCRENPRRVAGLASLAASLDPNNHAVLSSRIIAPTTLSTTDGCSQTTMMVTSKKHSVAADPKNLSGPQPTSREMSQEPSGASSRQFRNDEDCPLRRPVRKDSPFITPFSSASLSRRGWSLRRKKEMLLSPPSRDYRMDMPRRVESGDGENAFSRKSRPPAAPPLASPPGTPAEEEGESTVVIPNNDTEITVCSVSAEDDEELSIPTCASDLSADDDDDDDNSSGIPDRGRCDDRRRKRVTCCSAESTIVVNFTLDSERDEPPFPSSNYNNNNNESVQGINHNRNHSKTTNKLRNGTISSNRRGGVLTQESFRSADSTVSFPVLRWDALHLIRQAERKAPSFHRSLTRLHNMTVTRPNETTLHLASSGGSCRNHNTHHTSDSLGGPSWITKETLVSSKSRIEGSIIRSRSLH